MNKTTIVTALYDIGRDKIDGRTIEDYLVWFAKTLKLNCNFVIYTESKFEDFIWKHRSKTDTKVIVQPLNQIPYYKYKSKIEEILTNKDYRARIKDNFRIECVHSLYNIIQYSKFEWLRETILSKYFDSSLFFWMDAGCSRFFANVDIHQEWPNIDKLDPTRINIQGTDFTNAYLSNWPSDNAFMFDCKPILVGTLFGGLNRSCLELAFHVKELFEYYLDKGYLNNEQMILGILLKNNPSLFSVYIKSDGNHLPFFKWLSS